MKERNKNNSIIFLTTLSVYLGLVLVGGVAPTVFAQAATTRNFNVQDEIEVKDDLDKKPKDSEIKNVSAKDFPLLFVQLLDEIKAEIESGKYSVPVQSNFVIDAQYNRATMCSGTFVGLDFTDSDLFAFASNAFSKKFDPEISKILDVENGQSKNGRILIEANAENVSLKVSFTKSNAAPFAALLNREFGLSAVTAENILGKQLYENTKALSENNQVIIVTRLPRGSLDALLKQDAKAEK